MMKNLRANSPEMSRTAAMITWVSACVLILSLAKKKRLLRQPLHLVCLASHLPPDE